MSQRGDCASCYHHQFFFMATLVISIIPQLRGRKTNLGETTIFIEILQFFSSTSHAGDKT